MPTLITISGPAAAFRGDPEEEITDAAFLRGLDGLDDSQDVCSRYLHDALLEALALEGGTLRLAFDEPAGTLRVVTEYRAGRALKEPELEALVRETEAQWSDGLGEGAFDDYYRETGVRIDVWPLHRDRDVRVTQARVGGPGPRRPSPLLAAAKSGSVKRLAKLLDQGEDPDVVDRHGFTPLDHALHGGHTEAARLLVERGARVDGAGENGFCPLTTATIRGNLEIARLLLERGADVNGRNTPGQETVEYAPLLMACNRRQWEVGRLLLDHGADVNLRDSAGYTPLLMLDSQGIEFARLLVQRGADLDAHSVSGGLDPDLRRLLQEP